MRHGSVQPPLGAALRHGSLALAALALLVLLPAWSPVPARAVDPVASEPRAQQRLGDRPGTVTLAFDRQIDPGVAKVIVSGPDGANVTSGSLIVEGTNVTTLLRGDLPRGTYTVHYRINRRDGQPEGGAFQFSYGEGRFTTPADRSWSGADQEPAVLSGTDPNGPDAPDEAGTAQRTPGIEVTAQGPTTDPAQPPTEPPPSVGAPSATDAPASTAPGSDPTSSPPGSGEGGGNGFRVAAALVLAALVGGGLGVWRSRKGRAAPHE